MDLGHGAYRGGSRAFKVERLKGGMRPARSSRGPNFERKDERMRRFLLPVLVLAMVGLTTQSALGATSGAHFFSATASVNDGGALVVSWDETGLGNEDINYTLSADSTATYACINNGGNHPKAANKETVAGSVSTGGSFKAKNGRVQGELAAGPLSDPAFTCPSGQTRILAKVTYTNIVLTDTSNNVSIAIADVCRSFSSLFSC
jgi:hypothetical protein